MRYTRGRSGSRSQAPARPPLPPQGPWLESIQPPRPGSPQPAEVLRPPRTLPLVALDSCIDYTHLVMVDKILNVLELKAQLRDEQIETLVHRFYERVTQDDLLGPVFASRIHADEWPAHLAKMIRFWSTILRGTGTVTDPQHYNGNPMIVHHGLAGLTPDHFAKWLELFREVADEHLPPLLADSILHRAVRMGANLQKAACN